MSLYAVSREAGPAWTDGGAFAQPGVEQHVAFMNGLTEDGFLHVAGPLAGTEAGRIRVLLVAEAASEALVASRLADDPWEREGRIVTTLIEPWVVLAGRVLQPTGGPSS